MLLGYTNTEFEDVIYECGDGNVFVFLAVSVEHIFKIWVELIMEGLSSWFWKFDRSLLKNYINFSKK